MSLAATPRGGSNKENGGRHSRKRNRYNNFHDDDDEEEDNDDDGDDDDDKLKDGETKTKRTKTDDDDGDDAGRTTPTLGNSKSRIEEEEEEEGDEAQFAAAVGAWNGGGGTGALWVENPSSSGAAAVMSLTQQSQQELTQQLEDSCSPFAAAAAQPPKAWTAAERAAQLRKIPWARLVPRRSGGGLELLPKSPLQESSSIDGDDKDERLEWFLGLPNLHPRDRFNEYTLGRSPKCQVVVPKMEYSQEEIPKDLAHNIHSIVSNRHACIFCLVGQKDNSMEVYVEDQSGNGTLMNGTTLLRRGERRLLHTGDEIGLLNPAALRKHKCPPEHQEAVLRHYSYVFVNLYTSQQQQQQQQQQEEEGARQEAGPPPPPPPDMHDDEVVEMPPPPAAPTGPRPVSTETASMGSTTSTMTSKPVAEQERQRQQRRRQRRSVEEDYDLRNVLGTGTCGEVRRAIHRRTGVERAVKIIATTATTPLGVSRRQWQQQQGKPKKKKQQQQQPLESQGPLWESDNAILAEAELLQSLQHPYIVNLVDVYVKPGVAVYLVMELLEGGDLFDRIVAKGRYTEVEARRVLRRLLAALYYLHEERDICHRDLKPENILCVKKRQSGNNNPNDNDNADDDDVQVKLTDFGLAKVVTEEGLKTFCGTPLYFAPEVLRRRHTVAGRGRYGREADMWSLGIITYILLSGTPPFDPDEDDDDGGDDEPITFPSATWSHVSPSAIQFVRGLLQTDPHCRLSALEACRDEWILTPDGDSHEYPLQDPALDAALQRPLPAAVAKKNDNDDDSSPPRGRRLLFDNNNHKDKNQNDGEEEDGGGGGGKQTNLHQYYFAAK